MTRTWTGQRVTWAAALVVVAVVWVAWPIETRTEPEDAFTWAYELENESLPEQMSSRHRLSHVLKWGFWKLGIFERSYPSLIALSLMCAIGCLAMIVVVTRRWGWEWRWCLSVAVLTSGSYGFWRYSREAETRKTALSRSRSSVMPCRNSAEAKSATVIDITSRDPGSSFFIIACCCFRGS